MPLTEEAITTMNANTEKAVVLGAGIMGHGVAQLLAENGIEVYLVDQNQEALDRARGWIGDNLEYMVQLGELPADRPGQVLGRVHLTTELVPALSGAGYVLEAVTEDLAVKHQVWELLSQHAPASAILASNTSSYDINELTQDVVGPERVLCTHWFHPPQITPCVEVIPSARTGAATVEWILAFLTSLGKVPTLCRSAPGFVANRIQLAMAREAIALVEEGLATPAEIDRIVKTSFGFRLSAFGPFEIIDQAGADTYCKVYEYLYSKLPREQFRPPELLRKQVEARRLGLKSSAGFYDYGPGAADAMRRDRDRKLYARLKLVRPEWDDR
ncbi:MAG: 3-hydroxyacyl-CoA dehydrogenase family protein [Candidatus Latescibacterota bacterium]|jgi:3-hydroxyacyl-CoA dehydrogenase